MPYQSQKGCWTLEAMMEEAEEHDIIVSKRTFEMDIQAMRHDERLNDLINLQTAEINN